MNHAKHRRKRGAGLKVVLVRLRKERDDETGTQRFPVRRPDAMLETVVPVVPVWLAEEEDSLRKQVQTFVPCSSALVSIFR